MEKTRKARLLDHLERAGPEHLPVIEPLNKHKALWEIEHCARPEHAHHLAQSNPVVCHVRARNRPGGNVTGILRYVDGLAGKNLQLVTQLLPGAVRVGVLVNVNNSESIDNRRDTEAAAQKLPIKLVPVEVRSPDDIDSAFGTLASERVQAVVVLQDSMFFSEHRRITALAAEARLPAIWSTRLFAEDGGLISYGIDETDSFRRVAVYVDKILRGAKPADLPLELPTKFELVINLKTAKTLGIEIPSNLLALADQVIE